MASRKPKSPEVQQAAPAAATSASATDRDYFDHIRKVNDTFYDQIRIADQKAAYIFTFMLAFLVSSAEGRGVFRLARYQSGDSIQIIVSALMALAVIATLSSAILAVVPRVRTAATSLFWGAWEIERPKLLDARARGDRDFLFGEYAQNATNLSLIAMAKYRFVTMAFRGLLVSVTAYVVLLINAA